MGAWGAGSFDNDDAGDWADGIESSDDLDPVRDAIGRVLSDDEEDLDSSTAAEALAACEVIARLKGNWGVKNSYSESVDRWVEAHPQPVSDALVRAAQEAIARVLGPDSELRQLWEEGDAGEWLGAVEDLRRRVSG